MTSLEEGGQVLLDSFVQGFAGIVERPIEGAAEGGFGGFISGVANGLVGAVATPVAGAFGAVSRVTQGVETAARYYDARPMPRRRAPRTEGMVPLGFEALAAHIPGGQELILPAGVASGAQPPEESMGQAGHEVEDRA